jgi:HD-like signal output (HDOD) protein
MSVVQRKSVASRRDPPKGGLLVLSPGARNIVQEALREDVSVQELAALAGSDPAFALRVLSLANSAAYSTARTVTNVQQACSLLGIRGMRNVALGMLVADMVPAAEGASSLLNNCLRRALVARELAKQSGLVPRDDAFFAGLLLEIGLLHQACDEFEACVEAARSPGRQRMIKERALGLVPHPRRGAELARELSLPYTMVLAISEHHDPARPREPLAAICWATEFVASVLEAGHEARSLRLAYAAADQIGVKAEDLLALLERTPADVSELMQALDCASGAPNSGRGLRRAAEEDLGDLQLQYEELMRLIERLMDEREQLSVEVDQLRRALAEAQLAR